MYRLWEILLSNMSRPETFGMTLVRNSTHLCLFTNTQKSDQVIFWLYLTMTNLTLTQGSVLTYNSVHFIILLPSVGLEEARLVA